MWLLMWLAGSVAQGQEQPFVRHFSERDGLSHNAVRCLLRDRAGYLWVGTSYGLNRFDGYHFKTYLPDARQPQRSIVHDIINDLAEDEAGCLWIATRDGLNRYDADTHRFLNWQNEGRDDGSLPNSLVADLLPGGPHQLWLCCDNRDLCLMDTRTFRFVTFPWKAFVQQVLPAQAGREYQTIYKLGWKSACELWLHTNLGVFSFDVVSHQFSLHSPLPAADPENSPLSVVLHDPHGLTWLGHEDGLRLLDPQWQHFHFRSLSPANAEADIYRILDASSGARYALDQAEYQLLQLKGHQIVGRHALPGPPAILFEDSQHRIWLSAGSILFTFDPLRQKLQRIPMPEHLHRAGTKSGFVDMAEDSQGNLWFAHEEEGLLVWLHKPQRWWKPAEAEGFIGRNLSKLLADKTRQTVWIGSHDYGLFRYDEASGRFRIYEKDRHRPRHSLGAYIIQDICLDKQGRVWVATDPGGISRFSYDMPEDSAFTTLNVQDGLPSNQVMSIQTDGLGNLWAGTSRGLCWIDAAKQQVKTFNSHNGLARDHIDRPISCGAEGQMLIGDRGGFTDFYPDQVLRTPSDPRILLNGAKIFEDELSDSLNLNGISQLELSWRQNFFVFEFSSINFSEAEKNTYAYRLLGFNNNRWTNNGPLTRAAFTNVPPGEYTFEVRSGREGVWNPVGVRLAIFIHPPFWQRWWFRWLLVAGIAALVWAAWHYRIRQIQREEALKTAFNQRIAQVEMSALRAQMNPHFVFNCLSSINRFILVNEPDVASDYLTKFSRLIRLILDNSRAEQVTLAKELEALRLYIELESMRFGHCFDYSLQIAPDVDVDQLDIPPLLIQPLVENAIWHGLMHKKSQGELSLRIFYEQGSLCISVEDNGIGRAQAIELKSRSATRQKSHGLQLTAERIELIRELYGFDAQTQLEDLFHPDGTAAGTRATIRISPIDPSPSTTTTRGI